jgi:hypothetical protein
MANAFLTHLVEDDATKIIRSFVELSARSEDDDEFAAVYGLIQDVNLVQLFCE